MLDYDSGLRGDWKQFQDTLVEKGWWYDDSSEHITGNLFRQDNSRRHEGPAVRIQIWQSGCDSVPKSNRRTDKAGKRGSKSSPKTNRATRKRSSKRTAKR